MYANAKSAARAAVTVPQLHAMKARSEKIVMLTAYDASFAALLDRLEHNYLQMHASGYIWPVIDLQLRYIRGATFGQRLKVRASLVEWENRLKIHYLISDAETGERMTRASTVQVAVHVESGEMQLASPQVMLDAVAKVLS